MNYDTYSPENWPSFYDEMIEATHSDECETEHEIEFDYEPLDD